MPISNFDELEQNSSSKSDDESMSVDDVSFISSNHNCGSGDENHSSDLEDDSEMKEISDLAREDTRSLRKWRFIILSVLMAALIFTTVAMTLFLREQEDTSQAIIYSITAKSTKASMATKSEIYVRTMRDFARSISESKTRKSTNDMDTASEFPFVVVPKFELLSSHSMSISKSAIVIWAPLVKDSQLDQWSNFSKSEVYSWYNESYHDERNDERINLDAYENSTFYDTPIRDMIWDGYAVHDGITNFVPSEKSGPYAPLWQMSPIPLEPESINYNLLQENGLRNLVDVMLQNHDCVMSGGITNEDSVLRSLLESLLEVVREVADEIVLEVEQPDTIHLTPVLDEADDEDSVVGLLVSVIHWDEFLRDIFPSDVNGVEIVVHNSCNESYTYEVEDGTLELVSEGDVHDKSNDHSEWIIPLNLYFHEETALTQGHCVYHLAIYQGDNFYVQIQKQVGTIENIPLLCTFIVFFVFMIMGITFFTYDRFIHRRNDKIVRVAARANAIIASLFPTQVRDRLFAAKDDKNSAQDYLTPKKKMKTMITNGDLVADSSGDAGDGDYMYKTKPIADFFPETTILFADIAGFTAWSSVREPTQVFILLETLYRAFDEIARRRRVFKVETVGDCYVAVTGLPEPRKDHAIVMARFARECMIRMQALVRKLEVSLGPDTGDLSMRMGIHSGPVTAGVLRGENSRFQLFGDTMNTAARMEHTGLRDRIQVSQETADLLIASGKVTWVTRRKDVVVAKGKGEMQTYWLEIAPKNSQSNSDRKSMSSVSSANTELQNVLVHVDNHTEKMVQDPKIARLVDWNVDVLLRLIKLIVARRKSCSILQEKKETPNEALFMMNESSTHPLDEVKEIITLPGFIEAKKQADPEEIILPKEVAIQLHDYVSKIAALYNNNPFHNFEHASHVTMSVVKLLSRIVAPQQLDDASESYHDEKALQSTLHDHTYGITSDPLTQFSCVLSALIHDVDHAGVPNVQLVKEKNSTAQKYDAKSPAEQNSVDMAWSLLMNNCYATLRATIYQTNDELVRFRQLVVNSVMATDIADQELKALRNLRWDRAFLATTVDINAHDTINRKATIVIEHLIQASDVAHTMQHWHIYRKWNESYFIECYQAFQEGRSERNPADGWYQGEIGFFDYYIIPLAKKLKDCGVFGVSSDEYLNYAIRNRQEWESRGREVVAEMVEMVSSKEKI